MAKASRSSKKQPDFDPSELEDLIFSPAVGKGVGSHLIPSRLATVVDDVATVATSFVAPVDSGDCQAVEHPERESRLSLSTVDMLSPTPVAPDVTTVARSLPATEVTTPVPAGAHQRGQQLWITEHGDLVPQGRIKKIRLAQDVINAAEECVYDTLWNASLLQSEDKDSCRIVQAGYDYLVKRSRLSRKTIQRIVAKLLDKDFIAVDTRADIYQRTSTIYRVYSYKAVLDRHVRKGRLHVAKIGPGFAYAKPLNGPSDMTTVDTPDMPTVVSPSMATVARAATVTVVKMDRSTVVKMSQHLLDTDVLDNTSSRPLFGPVQEAMTRYGLTDDDAVRKLIQECRSVCGDCTADEITKFVHEKARTAMRRDARIQNPIGFLLTAVPKCFAGATFKAQRDAAASAASSGATGGREVAAQGAEERWRQEQEAALLDPTVPEQEKNLIRLCLGLDSSGGER